jgi:hypothetical protein
MKANKLVLAAVATIGLGGVAFLGCGGDDDNNGTDAGRADGGSKSDAAATIFGISDTGCYVVQDVTIVSDGCEFAPDLVKGKSVPGSYVRSTGTLSLGKQVGSPVQPSLGSGQVLNNAGQLSRNNTASDGACTWNEVVTGDVSVTANDTFTISFTDTQRTFQGCTNPPPPTGGTCTSTWVWTLKRSGASCADGGV